MKIPLQRFLGLLAVSAASGFLAGCLGPHPEPPLPAPAAKASVTHFAGTPISGPVPVDNTASAATQDAATHPAAAETKAVVARFYVLEKMPLNAFDPIGGYAKLITASRGGMPVLPTTRLTIGGRFTMLKSPNELWEKLPKADYGRETSIATLSGLLRNGQTASFTVEDPESVLDTLAGKPVYRKVTVQLHRTAPDDKNNVSTTLAVVLEDIGDTPVRARPATESTDDAGTPPTTQPTSIHTQRELALVPLPATSADEQSAAVLVPFHFAGGESEALAIVVQIATPARLPEDLVARADADVAAAAQAVRNVATRPVAVDSSLTQSLASLNNPDTRRASLVFLAGQTRAQLCADLVLAADADMLEKFSATVSERISAANPPADLGWQLDRLAFEALAQAGSHRRMAPELRAVLTSFAGEAGRHPSSLEELSQNLTSREELMRRLVAENMIYLEDNAPSSRIRAYDWLAARKQAPEGYDPLGRRKDREAALEKAAAQTGTTTGGQP